MSLTSKVLIIFVFILSAFATADAANFFDYDRKSDFGVYRPADRTWYKFSSEAQNFSGIQFGLPTDVLTPGDFDGDGITDTAVWRPSNGYWYILLSRSNKFTAIQWGMTTQNPYGGIPDIPVPADFDSDGVWDLAVFRPDNGVWYVLESTQGFNPNYSNIFHFGKLGDVPVPADYDGDGSADFAVFRTSNNNWYVWESDNGRLRSARLGMAGADLLVPTDYTGDGKADFAVYRKGIWLIQKSEDRKLEQYFFGAPTDIPVPADYDGDGKAECAVFRQGTWYVKDDESENFTGFAFGQQGDVPLNSVYVRESIVAVP